MFTNAKASFAKAQRIFTDMLTFGAVAMALALTPQTAQASDISQYFGGTQFASNGGFFNVVLNTITGPWAQIAAALLVIGSIWRLRNNFEWGEAGTTIMLVVLGVASLALIGSMWQKLGGHSSSGMVF